MPDELFTTLLEAASVHIERIVSHGHGLARWVLVRSRPARVGDRPERRCTASFRGWHGGDDARRFHQHPGAPKHRVEWTTPEEPTIWLAVHYGDQQ
jgi:cupin 2 domain-containing protein